MNHINQTRHCKCVVERRIKKEDDSFILFFLKKKREKKQKREGQILAEGPFSLLYTWWLSLIYIVRVTRREREAAFGVSFSKHSIGQKQDIEIWELTLPRTSIT